ncbi:DUF6496 domain-containing protein [Sphingomonas sp. IC-56]|uniref:DUF6496 domain-containing protein n=1 Tax=Sphingomonas sp. IC-56 TaxID=2898529 RepID=UPI001E5DB42A|nr:DUF6496 domain-containing protein [Sphingomonas sp. IC-56]MCD2324169.1 DUF6496 domain-containing protein [Sphingomonas sp. IC-56]
MAKQTGGQMATMERVMHEFKEGELETGAGKKVKSRRQAVAIGLSESGASNQQTPQQNARRRRQSSGDAPTKAELYERAQKQDIAGRSKMSKAQLAKAVS